MWIRFFLPFFILLSQQAFSLTRITSQVHDIDIGSKVGDEILVFLKSGDVVRLPQSDLNQIESLLQNKSSIQWFTFSLDKNRFVKRIESVSMPTLPLGEKRMALEESDYIPTTVADMKTVTKYISEGRKPTKEQTQCFNRAMVWSYEWWRKHSLRTNKVFIFWPKEYVRKYTFKWWFHVSPYSHVMDSDGVVKERVMDVKWLSKPYSFQDWADYHSSYDVKCRVVQKYSDYADHPFDTDRCYFIRANMYTWQPADLEMNEAWGYTKNAFNMTEVRSAYLEAFDIEL